MDTKLKAIVENLDDVDEHLRDFYEEVKDGDKVKFVVQIGDDLRQHPNVLSLHRAHEASKTENRKLKGEVTELKTKVEALLEN